MSSYTCGTCGVYATIKKSHLKRHENNCSMKSSVFTCETCPYVSDRQSNVNRHKLNCQIKCVECEEVFTNKRQLTTHVVKVHERICLVCGKKFSRKDNLKTHQKSQHDLTITEGTLKTSIGFMSINEELEKRRMKYTVTKKTNICDICGFISERKYNLKRHIEACHNEGGKRI